MSQGNVEVVQRLSGFWATRDFSAVEEALDPEAVLDVSRNVFNPGVWRGVDGFRRFVEQVDEMWENFQAELEEVIDAGAQVITATRIRGRGRHSGVEAEMETFQVWTLRDGKVLRLTGGFRSRADALEAAGLSE